MDKNFKGTKEEYLEFRRKRNIANKKYYSKPEVKSKKKLYKQDYDKKNRKKIRDYQNGRYKIQKEKGELWSQRFPEKLRAYRNRKYVKEKKRIADKKYNKKNREKVNKTHRKWKENNLEVVKKYKKKYNSSIKGIYNLNKQNHRRLALIKERPFDLSNEKVKRIFERDRVCVYCGSSKKLELDHIVPLKLGGNSLFNNFVIACKKCNTSKSGRDVFYWCKLQGIEIPEIVIKLLKE